MRGQVRGSDRRAWALLTGSSHRVRGVSRRAWGQHRGSGHIIWGHSHRAWRQCTCSGPERSGRPLRELIIVWEHLEGAKAGHWEKVVCGLRENGSAALQPPALALFYFYCKGRLLQFLRLLLSFGSAVGLMQNLSLSLTPLPPAESCPHTVVVQAESEAYRFARTNLD